MRIFVGSYTGLGGPGIATVSLDGDAISIRSVEGSLRDPSYVILSRDQKALYAVGGGEGRDTLGLAAAYRVDGDRLTLQNVVSTGAQWPCHLCLSPDERTLYVANYKTGVITAFAAGRAGLGERAQQIQHEGTGPNPSRQECPHAHWVGFRPGTRELYAVDLGIDSVMIYESDAGTGLLSPRGRVRVPGGLGPRHIAFSEDGRFAYLAHEMGNAVSAIRLTGGPELMMTLPTLPSDFQGESSCAAIRLSPDGETVYVSNRGHDSVAAFSIQGDGSLTPAGYVAAFGRTPRDFMPLEGGRMLIAHQDSPTLALVRMRGGETELISECAIKGAVCLCAG